MKRLDGENVMSPRPPPIDHAFNQLFLPFATTTFLMLLRSTYDDEVEKTISGDGDIVIIPASAGVIIYQPRAITLLYRDHSDDEPITPLYRDSEGPPRQRTNHTTVQRQ